MFGLWKELVSRISTRPSPGIIRDSELVAMSRRCTCYGDCCGDLQEQCRTHRCFQSLDNFGIRVVETQVRHYLYEHALASVFQAKGKLTAGKGGGKGGKGWAHMTMLQVLPHKVFPGVMGLSDSLLSCTAQEPRFVVHHWRLEVRSGLQSLRSSEAMSSSVILSEVKLSMLSQV